jgi:hypothetical protein
MEWLLIILTIRLASNLRRETLATVGNERMKLVRDAKQGQRQAQTLSNFETCKTRTTAIFNYHATHTRFAAHLFPVVLLLR